MKKSIILVKKINNLPCVSLVEEQGRLKEPHGFLMCYAQEKPDFDEQPESAPDGMVGRPEPILKLDEEIVFFTSRLLHSGHLTVSVDPDDFVSTSKCFLQSLQTYS